VRPVYVIGTCDTKGAELAYAVERVKAAGAAAVLVDISTVASDAKADVRIATDPSLNDRGLAVAAMAKALTAFLTSRGEIGAVLGLGGGGNTSIVTEAMRALPIGVPRLLTSAPPTS
jgi:uncharacterized protein (UPF0261 family)